MRILMISDHADPLAEIGSKEAGGQNIYIFYLAKFLGKLGVYVDIYTRWDRRNKKEVVKINGHTRVIRVKAGPKRYVPRDEIFAFLGEFAENILKRITREKIKYDIIHTNYWFSGVIGLNLVKKIKIPILHVYHSIGKIRFDTLKKFKVQQKEYDFFQKRIKWEREIAHKADYIVSTSPVEKHLIEKIFDISGEKIKMITIGVDRKVFNFMDARKARKKLSFNEGIKMILYVGRIEWRKGLGTLIYAFREVLKEFKKSKLYIIGGGRSKFRKGLEQMERDRLEKIIRELGLKDNIYFLGPKKQKSLRTYFSASDVCVVPSYYEPFGIVPLESMACGTPVVASRTGGMKFTILEKKTGLLAKPRDFQDLSKKIVLVLKKRKDYFSHNCLKRISENFNWEKIALDYMKFFNQITK